MAKEFQYFNKKYIHLAGTALKYIQTIGGSIAQEDIAACDHWPDVYKELFREDYSQKTVHHYVYVADGADVWQKFRVGLKGLKTCEKLYCLMWYWERHSPSHSLHEDAVRVNNYLGALKRGGFLDSNLHVIKG